MLSSLRETLTLSLVVSASLSGDNFRLNISNADTIVDWCFVVPFFLLLLDATDDLFSTVFLSLTDLILPEAMIIMLL